MPAAVDEPRDAFWSRYNRRSELPVSAATAVLVHTLVAALLVLTLGWFMHSPAKSPVVVQIVPDLGLNDEEGEGSLGVGGDPNELRPGESLRVPDPGPSANAELPAPKETMPSPNLADGPLSVPMAKSDFSQVDAAIRNKQPGAGKVEGSSKGGGEDKGAGPGGGKDDAKARSQRWVLRFRTEDGADYLKQLALLKAEVLVPLPPEEKKALYVADLKELSKQQIATADELKRLSGLVRFSDTRVESVRGVCDALKLDAKAKSFHAFFPKEVEEQLAKNEIGYRNRRPENIEQTVFQIRIKDGTAEIDVIDQAVKK